jgi:hypothetical protein
LLYPQNGCQQKFRKTRRAKSHYYYFDLISSLDTLPCTRKDSKFWAGKEKGGVGVGVVVVWKKGVVRVKNTQNWEINVRGKKKNTHRS